MNVLNCNGVTGKRTELAAYLAKHQVKVAALQETKLTSKRKTPEFGSQYKFILKDRPRNRAGGGLALIIHESVKYIELQPRSMNYGTLEAMGIKVSLGNTNKLLHTSA